MIYSLYLKYYKSKNSFILILPRTLASNNYGCNPLSQFIIFYCENGGQTVPISLCKYNKLISH